MEKLRIGGSALIDLRNWNTYEYQSSSKGNQPKYYKDGYWCKVDSYGNHEGLAEEIVSRLLSCTDLTNFVQYKSIEAVTELGKVHGCISRNMYNDCNIEFISLRHLLDMYGERRNITFSSDNILSNIENTVMFIRSVTGVDTLQYFGKLAYLDSIILNEDRHIMNVGVCFDRSRGVYFPAPIFDNGASLFCTRWTYRSGKSLDENISSALRTGRPFSKFHHKQVEAFRALGIQPIKVNKIYAEKLVTSENNTLYSDKFYKRAMSTLLTRLREQQGVAFEWQK